MKKVILVITIFLASTSSYSQTKKIVGAWIWRDSLTSFSLIIKDNGSINKHVGPIGEPILGNGFTKGTYKFKDNQKLIITWADKSSETYNIKIIDANTLQIQLKPSGISDLKTYIFVKVVDEEVEQTPPKMIAANMGFFAMLALRIDPDRHNKNQLQSQLYVTLMGCGIYSQLQ